MNESGLLIESPNGERHEVWRFVATAAIAVVLALGAYSANAAVGSISRSQVERIVQTEGPYVADRNVIRLQLAQQSASIASMTAKVDDLRAEVAQLNVELNPHR